MVQLAKIGLYFDPQAEQECWSRRENVFERYVIEVLEHARVPYQLLDCIEDFHTVDLLVIGAATEHPKFRGALMAYAEAGGIVISYGGLDSLRSQLGCKLSGVLSAGYAYLQSDFHQEYPLRFLEAAPWTIADDFVNVKRGRIFWADDNREDAALLQMPVGIGFIDRWAINIPKTIVNLQQGTAPVTEDGIPAPDGSANLDEGILKADDGFELDWMKDRTYTETGIPYFGTPYADLWREVLLEHLIRRAVGLGLTLPVVEHWPAGVNHVALISYDSDMNLDESAKATLEVLKEENVQSTWCMIAPGFSNDIYNQAMDDGHELALHYNALEQEDGIWSEAAFKTQLDWLKDALNENVIISNKNHYTRFEGWGELYEWCERHGIKVDQTRGPSKKGNIGFLFGTCQPYFPIALADEKNRLYDVLEIGFLTQDMNHPSLADTSIIRPFLEKVKRVGGVAHFLFHQFHVYNVPKVKEALVELIHKAKLTGFSFWTARQINDWERARRQIDVTISKGELQVNGLTEMEDIEVWIPAAGNIGEGNIVYKYGLPGRKQVMKVRPITVK